MKEKLARNGIFHHQHLLLNASLTEKVGLADTGALAINTGEFTGRSPKDRFIVGDDKTNSRVDWGDINQSITSENFERLLEDARNYLVGKNVYVRDGAVGADPATRINTRVITEKGLL